MGFIGDPLHWTHPSSPQKRTFFSTYVGVHEHRGLLKWIPNSRVPL